MQKKTGHKQWTADTYAAAVVAGEIVAGIHVVAACDRHLRDREADVHDWDPRYSRVFYRYLSQLRVPDATGRMAPWVVLPWQAFLIDSMFNWRVRPGDALDRVPGTRRFREVTLYTSKGSGKTTLFAAVALWNLHFDYYICPDSGFVGVQEPQCFVLASTHQQAVETALVQAREFLLTPAFGATAKAYGGESAPGHRITSSRTGGFLVAVSGQSRGSGGRRVQYLQVEELSEMDAKQMATVDAYNASTKAARQPLVVLLSNAGKERLGPAWEQRTRAIQVAQGDGPDDALALIYEVDPADVPKPGSKQWFPPKRSWIKSNPSLGHTVREDYVLKEIARADTALKRDDCRRLVAGIWPGAETELCTLDQYMALEAPDWEQPPTDASLYVGIDLGSSDDLTALAYLWEHDGQLWARVDHYSSWEGLRKHADKSTGHLLEWGRAGHIKTTTDAATLDYRLPASDLLAILRRYPDHYVCRDPWAKGRFDDVLSRDLGVEVVEWAEGDEPRLSGRTLSIQPHSQLYARKGAGNLNMESSIDTLSTVIANVEVKVPVCPVIRWEIQCVEILRDTQQNRRFSRADQSRKIDGIVAWAMACGLMDHRKRQDRNPIKSWLAEALAT